MTAGDERSVLDWANHLSTAAEASRLAVRLHLLTLLFAVGELYTIYCWAVFFQQLMRALCDDNNDLLKFLPGSLLLRLQVSIILGVD